MKQQAALIVFAEGTTASQVKAILNDLENELETDNHILDEVRGARIESTQTEEFDSEWGGVVIYQP